MSLDFWPTTQVNQKVHTSLLNQLMMIINSTLL
jgi:hypothetical protein